MLEIVLWLILGAVSGEALRGAARLVWRYSPAAWLVLILNRIEVTAFKYRTMVQQGYQLKRRRRQAREAEELRSILEEYGGVSGLRQVLIALRRIEESTS